MSDPRHQNIAANCPVCGTVKHAKTLYDGRWGCIKCGVTYDNGLPTDAVRTEPAKRRKGKPRG